VDRPYLPMQQTMTKFIIILSFLFFPYLLFGQSSKWELKRLTDGVEVYYRDDEKSGLRELKMIYYLDASLSSVVSLLNDVPNYKNWVYKLIESKVIDGIGENDFYYYNRMDFPWPLDDRDLVGHSKLWQEAETKVVHSTLETAHWVYPEKEGLVRITRLSIDWKIYPKNENQVKIEYVLQSDPGGNIPKWMVNLAIDQGPLQTVKNMRKELKKNKYKSAQLRWLK